MLVTKKELDYYYYPDQINTEYESLKRTRKRKKKKKKENIKVSYKLSAIGLAMIGLILSLFILYRYANITKVRLEITELEKQKVELEKEKEHLTTELESIKSSSKIEEDAMIKLGMDYPTEDQIVYINVKDMDMDEEINTKKEFILSKQFKSIVNLVLGLF